MNLSFPTSKELRSSGKSSVYRTAEDELERIRAIVIGENMRGKVDTSISVNHCFYQSEEAKFLEKQGYWLNFISDDDDFYCLTLRISWEQMEDW